MRVLLADAPLFGRIIGLSLQSLSTMPHPRDDLVEYGLDSKSGHDGAVEHMPSDVEPERDTLESFERMASNAKPADLDPSQLEHPQIDQQDRKLKVRTGCSVEIRLCWASTLLADI
jgi:hypothetical protein